MSNRDEVHRADSVRVGPSTRAVHAGNPAGTVGEAVVNPMYQTTTFFNDPDGEGEILYTRYGNAPNLRALGQRVCALEGAEACVAVGSGMAAMTSALLGCAGAGDHVVAARALFGGTRILLDQELARLGIGTTYVDFHTGEWEQAIQPNTRALLVEVPSNPLLRVVDLRQVARAGRQRGIPLIVDATFATPINLRPLEHGADLVVHSATKYLGGHSDVTAGVVSGGSERIAAVAARARNFGPALDPHAAWLVERGMKTLAVRMERHNRNGMVVAEWCATQPGIARVHYPGLPSHPDHALAQELLDGFGGMFGIELQGDGDAAGRFVRGLRLAKLAPTLGGVETLVSQPRYTSHVSLSARERREIGIADGFVRFSLGIEDAEDIIADIASALRSAGCS